MNEGKLALRDRLASTGFSPTEVALGALPFGLFLWWVHASGGYFATQWYPGALFLVALVVVVLLAAPGLVSSPGRATVVALVALAGFTAWSYLSITWADVPGDAWDGANRTALYLVVFLLFALLGWSVSTRIVLLGGFAVGVCALGTLTLLAAGFGEEASGYFNSGRLAAPVGYANGNAAVLVLGFWPSLFLASRREIPSVVRPFFLVVAGVLIELALLTQSRGAAIVFPLALIAYFALVPQRTRTFVFLLPVAVVVAAAFPALLDATGATDEAGLTADARTGAAAIGLSAAALLVVGALTVFVDRRVEVSARVSHVAGRALAVAAAFAAIAGLAFAVAFGDLGTRASTAWDDLDSTNAEIHGSSRLLGGLQTNRRDFWRVALDEFRDHPLVGVGAENFTVAYMRERRSVEETLHPHSFVMQVLSQTGVVGTALMAVFLVAALIAALMARARQTGLGRGMSAVALVIFISWLVHASIDWLWELPAVTAPALAALALAGSAPTELARRSATSSLIARGMVAGLALVVALSLLFPWLAAREVHRAAAVWRADPAAAATSVDRARRLNPLTDSADLVAGSIARRREDWDAMAVAYEGALERNPHSWYSVLQLALAQAKQGRRDEARTTVAVAEGLNPSEPLVDLVGGWLKRGEPVDVEEVANSLLIRHAQVTGTETAADSARQP